MEQLEFGRSFEETSELTVAEAFDFFWTHHYKNRVSGSRLGSRKALCRSVGGVYISLLTAMDMDRHVRDRLALGYSTSTVRNEYGLLTNLWYTLRRWKRQKYILGGFQFEHLKVGDELPWKDIPKPKIRKRTHIVTPLEFSAFIEHAPERLAARCFFAIDTAMSEADLVRLKTVQFNAVTGCFEYVRWKTRHKTQAVIAVPATERCFRVVEKALAEGREFLLDWVNHRAEFEETLEKATATKKVRPFQFRDLRKSNLNVAYDFRGDIRDAQFLAGHADPRTTHQHYIVSGGHDLRPVVKHIEQTYSLVGGKSKKIGFSVED